MHPGRLIRRLTGAELPLGVNIDRYGSRSAAELSMNLLSFLVALEISAFIYPGAAAQTSILVTDTIFSLFSIMLAAVARCSAKRLATIRFWAFDPWSFWWTAWLLLLFFLSVD